MHARLALGMSQRAVGALASLSADKVWKIENNRAPALSLRDAAQLGAVLGLDPSARTAVELEARLEDLQAMTRRHALKRRDDPVNNFLLVIADTVHNRRVLAEYGGLLPDLPRLRTAAVLALPEAVPAPADWLRLLQGRLRCLVRKPHLMRH